MIDPAFFDSEIFRWVVLPLLIFLSRIVDVTLGTLRIIFVNRGMRLLAPLLGFFEILIWLIAIQQIMANMDNWLTYVAYAAGFAAGNYAGIYVEQKLSIGVMIIRIITRREEKHLVDHLRKAGFGATSVNARGESGPVNLIFTVVKRKSIPKIYEVLKEHAPKAFYTIEDVRHIRDENVLNVVPPTGARFPFSFRSIRVSK